jgi:cytochrome b
MQQVEKNRIESGNTVKVWDAVIRLFHWTLVAGLVTAYISGEIHASEIHVLIGYALCVLLAIRIYWGFKGSEYARFRSFIFPASEMRAYMRSMFVGHPKHYLGHNPAGALNVFALLATVLLLLVTGLATLSVIDFEGPLLFMANLVSDEASYSIRHIHEFIPNVGLALVALHLMGVVAGSIQHRENLVKAMITGKKKLVDDQNNMGNIK